VRRLFSAAAPGAAFERPGSSKARPLQSSALQVFVFIPAFGVNLAIIFELDTRALLLLGNGELAKDADRC
jgi:hypothetical protein